MEEKAFTSETEINETYRAHLESLISSGIPFDEHSLRNAWADSITTFREEHSDASE